MYLFISKVLSAFAGTSTYAETNGVDPKFTWIQEITQAIDTLLWPLLIVVAACGTIYAVVLGVNMARAEDAGKREEAKKRIINFVIALAVTVLLILLLKLFVQYLPIWLGIDIPKA